MMEPSMVQAGQYAPPSGPSSNPPTSQMAGMNIGARHQTQMAPGGPQPPYNYGGTNPVKQAPPVGNFPPGQPMGNFPQRSSNYSNQSLRSGNGSTSSGFSGGPPTMVPPTGGHQPFGTHLPMSSSAPSHVSNGPPMAPSGGTGLGMPPQNLNFSTQQTSQPGGSGQFPNMGSGNYGPQSIGRGSGPLAMGNQPLGPPNVGGPPGRDGALSSGPPTSRALPTGYDPPTGGPHVGPLVMSGGQFSSQSGPSLPQMGLPTSGIATGPPMGPPTGTPLSGPPVGPPSGGPPSNPPMGPPSGPPSNPPIGPSTGVPHSGPPMGPSSGGPPSNPPMGPPTGALPSYPPLGPPTGGQHSGPPMGPPSSGVPPGPAMGLPTGPPMDPSLQRSQGPLTSNFSGPPTLGPGYPRPPGQYNSPSPGMGPGMTAPPTSMAYGRSPAGMGPPRAGGHAPAGPPGSPGMIQQQPKGRIDPDNMPNPVEVMKHDQDQRGHVPYSTSSRDLAPPLVTTNFAVIDDGNASPRYIRSTMYTVPCSKDLLNSCKIPMGLVIQPYAQVPKQEDVLELVDCGAGGPIRCNRCKAYMSPFARFVDGGRKYMCPVCQCSNEVPPEYFCHLDHTGRRTDVMQRPELRFGSVEFVANKEYCKDGKLPRSPAYIFMIDVSFGNIQAGLLHLLSSNILRLLENLPGSSGENGSPIKVGFVTYDRVLQFYNVKASMAQPQMMVMTDVNDVFVPMTDGFLVNLEEARTVLESLMAQLPEIFSANKTPQVVLEPVVRAGMEALKASGRNGRLFVFHSSLPSAQATGLLKNRLDTKLLGTDKEKTLLNPASSPYQKLAEECVQCGVAVELFLFPTNYTDVATLGSFVSTTGGELHYYKNFTTKLDGDRLLDDLEHSLSRPTAFDCVMRVRASTGLRPTGFYGSFFMSNTTDIELGNIDTDKAIAVEIKHDDKLREDENAFFQAALLYTDLYGQRRLRIHNLAMGCSAKFLDVYRCCEMDTIVNFFSKSIVTASLTMPYKSIRENFSHQVAVILSCYRKNCSQQSPPGQLILPESLKLLPMYANCLLKSDALLSPPIVGLDEKCWLMQCLLSMPTEAAGAFIYPRMYSLQDLDLNAKGLPPLMRCTGQKLQDNGLYVIVNGVGMVLWLGVQLPVEAVQKLFGVPSLAQLNPETMQALPALDNPLSFRVRGVLELLQSTQHYSMKLIVCRQKDKGEVFFRRQLKEDKGAGQWEGTTYIDFLCQIHREIKEILS